MGCCLGAEEAAGDGLGVRGDRIEAVAARRQQQQQQKQSTPERVAVHPGVTVDVTPLNPITLLLLHRRPPTPPPILKAVAVLPDAAHQPLPRRSTPPPPPPPPTTCSSVEIEVEFSSPSTPLPLSPPPPSSPPAATPCDVPHAVYEADRVAVSQVSSVSALLEHPFPEEVSEAAAKGVAALLERWEGGDEAYWEDVVPRALAAASDTCSGAGRNTGRGATSRDNLRKAAAAAHELLRQPRPPRLSEVFMTVNALVYCNVLEATLEFMGRSRTESRVEVKAGRTQVLRSELVDAALKQIDDFFASEVGGGDLPPPPARAVEVLSRLFLALISVHPCPNGNGRTTGCILAALARRFALPPPLFTLQSCRLIHDFSGATPPLHNSGPADSVRVVFEAMCRGVQAMEEVAAPGEG